MQENPMANPEECVQQVVHQNQQVHCIEGLDEMVQQQPGKQWQPIDKDQSCQQHHPKYLETGQLMKMGQTAMSCHHGNKKKYS